MRKKAFFANWQTIISTGILGTYVAFAIIAVMLYAFSRVLRITLAVPLLSCTAHHPRDTPSPVLPITNNSWLQSWWLDRPKWERNEGRKRKQWRSEVRSCGCVPQDCLALGAIFATTDSVAVLQVLNQERSPLLFNLVFGEGVINDATSVALLRTVQVGHRFEYIFWKFAFLA
jgi:Sodium/hydrogen exchanger family